MPRLRSARSPVLPRRPPGPRDPARPPGLVAGRPIRRPEARPPFPAGAPEAGAIGLHLRSAPPQSCARAVCCRGVAASGSRGLLVRAWRLAERSSDGALGRSPAGCPRSGSLPWVSEGPAAATSRTLRRAVVWGRAPEAQGAGTFPKLRSRTPRAAAHSGSGPLWRERGGWLWGHVLTTPPCPVFLTVR